MYTLQVFYPRTLTPEHVEELASAAEVLTRISALLQQHGRCEKVVVWMGPTRLFAVDCKGNRIPD